MRGLVEKIAWYAEKAGLTLVDERPRFDADGDRVWLCRDKAGVIEPYTEMAIIESAFWQKGALA